MNQRAIFKILTGLAGVYVCAGFNAIFFLNLSLYNFVNLILFGILALLLIHLFIKDSKDVASLEYLLLFLVFMAGTGMYSRSKIFFFLFLVSCYFIIHACVIKKRKGAVTDRKLLGYSAGSALISLSMCILIKMNIAYLIMILAACVILLALTMLIFVRFNKDIITK